MQFAKYYFAQVMCSVLSLVFCAGNFVVVWGFLFGWFVSFVMTLGLNQLIKN